MSNVIPENISLTKENSKLWFKIIQLKQKFLTNAIIINCISKTHNENLIETIKIIGHELNIQVQDNMINDCYRIKHLRDNHTIYKFIINNKFVLNSI